MVLVAKIGAAGPAADEAWLDRLCRPAGGGGEGGRVSIERDFHHSFQWHDRFLVGHPEIDSDHQRFFACFADIANRGGGLGTLASVALFLELVDEIQRHLATEERILDQVGFTMLDEHRSHHRALVEQAGAALSIGADGEWATAFRLLSMAVLEHIVLEDAKLRHCLAAAACVTPPAAGAPPEPVIWPGH